MYEKHLRRKKIFFLIGLIAFAILIVRSVSKDSLEIVETSAYTVSEDIKLGCNSGNCAVEQSFFLIDEDLNPVQEIFPEVVLSEKNVLGQSCVSPSYTYTSEKICSRTQSFNANMEKEDGELEVGQFISRTSSISLTSIVVPPLINGSPTMDSSVRQIYTEEDGTDHWTLRPSGEMVNNEIVQGNAYPGDNQTVGKIDSTESSQTKPFGITYSLESQDEVGDSESNEFSISKYQKNDCGDDCRNSANPTPEKYLVTSSILAQSKNYPKYYENIPASVEEEINDCGADTRFLTMDVKGTRSVGCTRTVKEVLLELTKEIKSTADAIKCSLLGESSEECIDSASIVVIMESPWGAKPDCKDGKCVTEFNDLRNGDYTNPGGNSSGKVYVLTDCYANVAGTGSVKLSCAWDIDYITQELEFQSHDNTPLEVYPGKMDYIKFHVEESENRTDPVFEM